MLHRMLIEFVVDVPDAGVAKDVQTRLAREHQVRVVETLVSVMGYVPLQAPERPGIAVAYEPVTWSASEQDWIGEDDDEDDDDDDDEDRKSVV